MVSKGQRASVIVVLLLLAGCASAPPKDPDNICKIFREKHGWFRDAYSAHRRWGAPISVMMAFMYQESGFNADAKPPRRHILWIIPWTRPASARGYSQATNETWDAYKRATGRWLADRGDFSDAIDFMGWYIDESHTANRIPKDDAYHLYLAYYLGQGGYARRVYLHKRWLRATARKVEYRAHVFRYQLKGCEKELRRPWYIRILPFF